VQEGVEADLAVDFLDALDVGLRSALGAKQAPRISARGGCTQ
jgi:hypothetical protein